MKYRKTLRIRFLETIISLIVSIYKLKKYRFTIEDHNEVSVLDYPDPAWSLLPFPSQKGRIFNADNLATVTRHDFINSKRFSKARNVAERRWGDPGQVRNIAWRLNIMLWAYGLALRNPKAKNSIFVECGTGRGYMAAGVADYFAFDEKTPPLYLIDTFTSHLVVNSTHTCSSPAHFAYSDGDEEVKKYFSQYHNVNIIKGFIPDALEQLPDLPICFLHIDLNSTTAENAALDRLQNRLVPGAVIIFDDYGGPGGSEQALVHEKFSESANRDLLVLPTGQALILW